MGSLHGLGEPVSLRHNPSLSRLYHSELLVQFQKRCSLEGGICHHRLLAPLSLGLS